VISKHHRLKYARATTRSKQILYLIHSDVWESLVSSPGGAKFLVSFINDYSRRLWMCPVLQEKVRRVFSIQRIQSKGRA